jgi:hypothetical protein
MTSLEAALCQISRELTEARIPFALVGGLALSVRTEPRFTRDADLAVALASDAAAEALIHNLRTHGYGKERGLNSGCASLSMPTFTRSFVRQDRRSPPSSGFAPRDSEDPKRRT